MENKTWLYFTMRPFPRDVVQCFRMWPFGSGELPVSTDEKRIDEALSRSVAEILPSKEELKKVLMSGKRLRIYIGADATGPQLHLGHATNFLLMEKLRQLGHEIIILFGDFTARIGDPTDKDAARKQLTIEEINGNIREWKKQVEKIIPFSGPNAAQILRNSVWLSKLTFAELIELSSAFTVQHMLERDMFERRMKAGKPVYVHEFFYPLMQGYDSVAMDVDVEVGGTDQTFNMLAGRTLQRKYHNKNKFVIATTLLENPVTGKKLMSKSEGGYIALDDTPEDMYGKTMALPDEVLKQMFIDATTAPLAEIPAILELHPKEAKMRLAREIVTLYHGSAAARTAEDDFTRAFTEGGAPNEVKEIVVANGTPLHEALASLGESKTELRRLVAAGAITVVGGGVFRDINAPVTSSATLKIGKHRFLKIRVE